jgi:hypothetical protein
MRTSADYRELAGHCVRLAQAASTPEHRSLLLNIAHAWLRLAEGAEFDRKLALASPRPQADLGPRRASWVTSRIG